MRLQLYQLDYAFDYQVSQETKLSLNEQIELNNIIKECSDKINNFLYLKKISNRGIFHKDIRNTEGFKSYCLWKKLKEDSLAINEEDININNKQINELIRLLKSMEK